jgi:hypothetical protein
MDTIIVCLIAGVPFILLCLFALVLYRFRRPRRLGDRRPALTSAVRVDIDPISAFRVIVSFALQNGYGVEDVREDMLQVLLSKPASWGSWGYYYYVQVASEAEARTIIDTGVDDRLGVWTSPGLWHERQRFVSTIRAAILVAKPNSLIH